MHHSGSVFLSVASYCCLERCSREQGGRGSCQNRFLFVLLAETNSVGMYRKLLPQKEMRAYVKNAGKIHISEIGFLQNPSTLWFLYVLNKEKLSMIKVRVILETIKAKLRIVGMESLNKNFSKTKKINKRF